MTTRDIITDRRINPPCLLCGRQHQADMITSRTWRVANQQTPLYNYRGQLIDFRFGFGNPPWIRIQFGASGYRVNFAPCELEPVRS